MKEKPFSVDQPLADRRPARCSTRRCRATPRPAGRSGRRRCAPAAGRGRAARSGRASDRTAARTCAAASCIGHHGAAATFAITGTVDSNAAGSISNTASVTAPPGTADPSPVNNSATNDNPRDRCRPTRGSKSRRARSPASPVAALSSPWRWGNNGPSAAQNVHAVITVPSAFAVGSAAGSGWSCSVALGVVTCDLAGALGAGVVAPSIDLSTSLAGTAGAILNGTKRARIAVTPRATPAACVRPT